MDRPRIIGSKLVHERYICTRSKKPINGKNYWDCQKLREKLCTSRMVTPKKKWYEAKQRLRTIVGLYIEHAELGTVIDYLRGLAHTIVLEY